MMYDVILIDVRLQSGGLLLRLDDPPPEPVEPITQSGQLPGSVTPQRVDLDDSVDALMALASWTAVRAAMLARLLSW